MAEPDYRVELVDSDGNPDMTVAVVGDIVVDLTGATPGEVLTVQPDGTVAADPAGGGGAVDSVNGQTGVVVLDAADVGARTAGFVGCHAYRAAALNVTDSSQTPIEFDAEVFDTSTMHDNSTDPSRITVPAGLGGYWRLTGQIGYSGSATGIREASINKNGAQVLAADAAANANATTVMAQGVVAAVAGDYFELAPFQNSTATRAVTVGSAWTYLIAEFVGT